MNTKQGCDKHKSQDDGYFRRGKDSSIGQASDWLWW